MLFIRIESAVDKARELRRINGGHYAVVQHCSVLSVVNDTLYKSPNRPVWSTRYDGMGVVN